MQIACKINRYSHLCQLYRHTQSDLVILVQDIWAAHSPMSCTDIKTPSKYQGWLRELTSDSTTLVDLSVAALQFSDYLFQLIKNVLK